MHEEPIQQGDAPNNALGRNAATLASIEATEETNALITMLALEVTGNVSFDTAADTLYTLTSGESSDVLCISSFTLNGLDPLKYA